MRTYRFDTILFKRRTAGPVGLEQESLLWGLEVLVNGVWEAKGAADFSLGAHPDYPTYYDAPAHAWYCKKGENSQGIGLRALAWATASPATALRFYVANINHVELIVTSLSGEFACLHEQSIPMETTPEGAALLIVFTFPTIVPNTSDNLLTPAATFFNPGNGWMVNANSLAFSGVFKAFWAPADTGLQVIPAYQGGVDDTAKAMFNATVQVQGQAVRLALGVLVDGVNWFYALGTPVLCPANIPTQLVVHYNPELPGRVTYLVFVPMSETPGVPLHIDLGVDVPVNFGVIALQALPQRPEDDPDCFWSKCIQTYQGCEHYQPDPPPPPPPPPPEPGPKDGLRLLFISQPFSSFSYNMRITYGAGNTDLFDFPANTWIPDGNGMSVVDAHTAHIGSGQGGSTEIRFEKADKHNWYESSIPGVRPATLTFTITLDSPYDGSSSLNQTFNFIAAGGSWNILIDGGSGNFNLDCSTGVAAGQTVVTRTVPCFWQP